MSNSCAVCVLFLRPGGRAVVMFEDGAVGPLVGSFGQHQERPPGEVVVDVSIAALVADALVDPNGEPL